MQQAECRRLTIAHFLQLVMISFAHFLQFQLHTIFAPQSVAISGHETITCTGNCAYAMKSVSFSLMVLLNVVQSSFLKCAIFMDYTMDIMFF